LQSSKPKGLAAKTVNPFWRKNNLFGLQKWAGWIIDENSSWIENALPQPPKTTFHLATKPEVASSQAASSK
jgi:hypothetical protein